MYHNRYSYSTWNYTRVKSSTMQYNYRSLSYDHHSYLYNYIFNNKVDIVSKRQSKYYRYSSGMNHPFGYKNIDLDL